MKFELYTLQNGGTKVAECECFSFQLFDKIKEAIHDYDSEKHYFRLNSIVIITDCNRRVCYAQNRSIDGYSWCCWKSRNEISKKWQKEFNRAFDQGTEDYMGW